jgi:Putative transposase/Transposase zinc-binding domain
MPLGRARRAYRGLRGLRPQPHRLQLISQPPPAFAGAGYCPKCQGAAATDWLAAREADLLPVGYCHVVFTLPAEIYLARYTHRVAIANSRLVALDARGVTFHYKDYRGNGQTRCRTMTLSAGESAGKGFHRIRHYGLLARASCKANIARAKELMAASMPQVEPPAAHDTADPDATPIIAHRALAAAAA